MRNISLFETTGFSMWPFLRPKEKLIVKKVPEKHLKVGDIILYQAYDKLVCHRLVKKTENKGKVVLHARGDNSGFSCEPVTQEMFLGKVVGIVKRDKIIGLDSQTRQYVNRLIVTISPIVRAIRKNSTLRLLYKKVYQVKWFI